MKRAIYYAVARGKYCNRYKVLAVTSASLWGRINGRWHDSQQPTHFGKYDKVYGKFEDAETARAFVDRIDAIEAQYEAEREPLRKMEAALWSKRDNAIDEILKLAKVTK